MKFVNEKILSKDDILLLKDVSPKLKWNRIYQHFNIFGGEIALRTDEWSIVDPLVEKFRNYLQLDESIRTESYFLNYTPGAFARVHPDRGTLHTVVTLYETNNLVGGETVVMLPYERPPEGRMSNLICNRNDNEVKKPPYNQNIIPTVIYSDEGDSMIYGPKLQHGVSKVVQGSRKVFVTWFMKE